jgi:predicted permease
LAGVALAYGVLPVMLALAPGDIPRITESAVNTRALTAALLFTLLTGCAFGLAPALRLSRTSLVQTMKRAPGRVSTQKTWLRSVLVSGQVAGSLALCVLAGLVGKTFLTLLPSDPGFEPQGLSFFSVYLPSALYPTGIDRSRLQEEMLRRVGLQPGVTAVAFAGNIPFSGEALTVAVRDARAPAMDSTGLSADVRAVSANYHELLHIPLRRGRTFTALDAQGGTAVAIVNETLARRLDPRGNVIGKTVHVGRPGSARDTRTNGTDLEILNEIHVPHAQRGSSFGFLVMRSGLDQGQLTRLVRREIRLAAPALPLLETKTTMTMSELMRRSLAGPRFSAALVTTFSVIATLLAAMGVFGLVSYVVAQRRHEFGIRSALGARPRDLALTALQSAIGLTVVGVGVGLAVAAFLTRFIETQLYAVEPLDAATFIGAGALMMLIAGMAAAIPARQALRIDPMATLR